MSKVLTSRSENYSEWYNDLIIKGGLADYSAVRGCMVIKPYGYGLWEHMRDTLDKMLKGQFTRFDVFAGPIKDNQGKVVVPAGEKLQQSDLDQFPPGAPGLECKYCMHWWAEGIIAELPPLQQ